MESTKQEQKARESEAVKRDAFNHVALVTAEMLGMGPVDVAASSVRLAGALAKEMFVQARAGGDNYGDQYGAVGALAAMVIIAGGCKFDDAMIASIRDTVRRHEGRTNG